MEDSLGHKLRTARESAGITVDDAVYRERIPRAVVTALEAEDFGFFTSPLYARSFLNQYSKYVGVDVEPWLDSLVPTTLIDGDNVESLIQSPEPATHGHHHNHSHHHPAPETISTSSGNWAALWLISITGALIWGGFQIFERFDESLSETSPAAQQVVTAETAAAAPVRPVEVPRTPAKPPAIPSDVQAVAENNNQPESPRRAIIVREE